MGPGCGEVAGGGMSVGMGCVRVFNTGDDGGGKLLEATLPQQVWTNCSSPGDGQSDKKKETCTDASCPKYSLVGVCLPFSDSSPEFMRSYIPQNPLCSDIQYN